MEGLVDIEDGKGGFVVRSSLGSTRNRTGQVQVAVEKCFVRPELAQKLRMVNAILFEKGLQLAVRDCYRPLFLQRDLRKDKYAGTMAIAHKSKHPRGAAVDVSVLDLEGNWLPVSPEAMPFHSARMSSARVAEPYRSRRNHLKSAMRKVGLKGIRTEWWHWELRGKSRIFNPHDIPVEAVPNWQKASE